MSVDTAKVYEDKQPKYAMIEDENGKKLKRYCERHKTWVTLCFTTEDDSEVISRIQDITVNELSNF